MSKIKLEKGEKVCVHLIEKGKLKRIEFGRFATHKEAEDFYNKYVKPYQNANSQAENSI